MAMSDRIHSQLFSTRGWGLLGAGAVALLAAQVMGRRDLLVLAVTLFVLPLLALAGIRAFKPDYRVYREFFPSTVEASAQTTVRLAIARGGPGHGPALMEERLPARFGESPAFRFPARTARGRTSHYEYHLRSAQRGMFRIGPVTAEFTDPFGLSVHRRAIDAGEILTVTPAAVELPATGLAGARGNDGVTATRIRANPSDDDVMTREYRHGDPMRRVHWAATARHGALMVRQEESVTTPEATLILDHRASAYLPSAPAHPGRSHGGGRPGTPEGGRQPSNDAFEWAVTAAMSICAHLAERNYALRCLDPSGQPAFLRSPSSPAPTAEEFIGSAGLTAVAESLAAIGLSGPEPHAGDRQAVPRRRSTGPDTPLPFDDGLMDKLAAHKHRGPLLAVLGALTVPEARALAPAAGFGVQAYALLITDRTDPAGEALEVLRLGGWRAAAVTAATPLAAAWAAFDQDGMDVPAGPDGHRRAKAAP